MGKKKHYAYCPECEREILNPKRKSMDKMYYTIWVLIILASMGFAVIPLLIYRFIVNKNFFCPNCDSKLIFYNSPEESPEPKTQIERILKTIEMEKKEKEEHEPEKPDEEYIFCPFCQKELTKQTKVCPNCGTRLNGE